MSLERLLRLTRLGDQAACAELRVEARRRGDDRALFVALTHATPSPEGFAELCISFAREPQPDAALERYLSALERWPDTLRVAPGGWLRAFLAGNPPVGWPLVRAVVWDNGVQQNLDLPKLERLAETHIRALELSVYHWQYQGLEVLAGSQLLDQLHTLVFDAVYPRRFDGIESVFASRATRSLHTLVLNRISLQAEQLRALTDGEGMPALCDLTLSRADLRGAHLWNLAHWPGITRLKRLALPHNSIDDSALRTLLGRLDANTTTLDLRDNLLHVSGYRALHEHGHDISDVVMRGASPKRVEELVTDPVAEHIRRLTLSPDPQKPSDDYAYALAASTHLDPLEHLELQRTSPDHLSASALQALTHTTPLSTLRSLKLSGHGIGSDGLKVLAESPLRLDTLIASYCNITFAGVIALARAPLASGLRHLDLGGNPIGDNGATTLASSPSLSELRSLDVSHCELSLEGLRSLRDSLHLSLGLDLRHAPLRLEVQTHEPRPEAKAKELLEYLVRVGQLEVEPDFQPEQLARGFAARLRHARKIRDAGADIAMWLMEQPGVVDLYATDEALDALVKMR